jgi:hypothetical protein
MQDTSPSAFDNFVERHSADRKDHQAGKIDHHGHGCKRRVATGDQARQQRWFLGERRRRKTTKQAISGGLRSPRNDPFQRKPGDRWRQRTKHAAYGIANINDARKGSRKQTDVIEIPKRNAKAVSGSDGRGQPRASVRRGPRAPSYQPKRESWDGQRLCQERNGLRLRLNVSVPAGPKLSTIRG